MLKRITHIALSFLLLTATMGISVSKHYCGSRLVEVSINSEAIPCCADMGNSGCCHDETEYFQFDEDFVSPDFAKDVQIAGLDILFPMAFVYIFNTPADIEKDIFCDAESPPILSLHTSLHFLQTFLI